MKRFGILVFALLLLATFAFAAPSITINQPSSTSVWWNTRTIDFNLIDENASPHSNPPVVTLYYSTTSNGQANVIVADTNVDDGTGIVCVDYNFVNQTNCTYSWSIPTNLVNGYYYVDGNYLPRQGTTSYAGSSSRFEVSQKLSTNSCGLVNLFPLLVIAALIVASIVAALSFVNGGDLSSLTVVVISALIIIVILMLMPAFMAATCG